MIRTLLIAALVIVSNHAIAARLVSMSTRGDTTYCYYDNGAVVAVPVGSGCP